MKSYLNLAESILKKCLEVYDLDMIVEIESMIQKEMLKRDKCKTCTKCHFSEPIQKMFEVADCSDEVNFDDDFAEDTYDQLLASGLFFVMYPELTGNWEIDKQEFRELDKKRK